MNGPKKVWIDRNDCGLATLERAERERQAEVERRRQEEIERKRREEAERQRQAVERKQNQEKERLREQELERQKMEEQRRKKEADEAARRQKEEEKATQPPSPEILPPASKALLFPPAECSNLKLPPIDSDAIVLPDLSHLEREMRRCAEMLDLDVPEGWLDSLFGRLNHRIEVKTERGQLLAGYMSACNAILEEAHKAIQTAGALQRDKYQWHSDRLDAIHQMVQKHYDRELVRLRVLRQNAIEDAEARDIIAAREANIRRANLEGRPLPPPPPPPPPVDEVARSKERAARQKQAEIDLELQDMDLKADAGREKIARAKARSIAIFQNVSLSAGEVHASIQQILDAYGLDWTILPVRIQQFMESQSNQEGYRE